MTPMPLRTAAAALLLAAALAAPTSTLAKSAAAEAGLTPSHGISSFGALKYGPDFGHFDYVNPDAPKGGEIRLRPVIATRTFDSFNPYVVRGDAADGAQYLFDSLMARAYDEPDALYGLLAESVATPEDRSFAIFTLRAEARFSDGAPVTAEDVAWSIQTLRDEGAPFVSLPLRRVVEIDVLDPRTVRFGFDPDAKTRDLPALVAQQPIFSKAFFAGREFDAPSLEEPPLGSGPYRVGAVAAGRTVTYELREDYWARDLPVMRGQYNFAKLSFEYFSDHDAGRQALAAGEIDLNEEFSSLGWATKYDFPAIDAGFVKREVLSDGRPAGTQGYWLNTRREKFSDPRVREAIGLAFDFEWSNERLFYGLYNRTESVFQNSDLEALGPPSDAELALLEPFRDTLPEAVFSEALTPPVSDGSGSDRRLLRRATRLLRQAGWTIQDGVLVNEAGEPLEIEFLDRAGSAFNRITQPFQKNLELLGIQSRIREVDFAQYERRANAFDFDVVVGRFVFGATPGPQLRGVLSSESRDAEGANNLAGVASPAIDALITAIENAQSREELQVAGAALDRVFRAGFYWVPNWYKASHTIAYWDRFGRPQDLGIEKPPFDRGVISTWWYDVEKSASLDARRDG